MGCGSTCLSTNFTRENFGLAARGAAAELRGLVRDFFREDLSTFFHVMLQLSLRQVLKGHPRRVLVHGRQHQLVPLRQVSLGLRVQGRAEEI